MTGAGESVLVVLTTAPGVEDATRIGRILIDERLAACANVMPGLTSIFRWEGDVQEEAEVLVLLKTTEERLEELRARLVEVHPYDVPEVLALPVVGGEERYMSWVRDEVEPRP